MFIINKYLGSFFIYPKTDYHLSLQCVFDINLLH